MELESKILSREIQRVLYDKHKTLGTAESCTGGRIAEAIISTPGASSYFKGSIIAYTNDIKETLLSVDPQVLEEQTAVSEQVAKDMAIGAIKAMGVDFAVSVTGIAGPGGEMPNIPVGTIWIGYGDKDEVRAFKLTENFGRDINLAIATNKALLLLLEFIKEKLDITEE
ncbi:CinA family protein [Prevotella sp.]|uniref:CinA family protein n=1 Tax=Prevotella sp. TaxID=59823 RepID=UPI002F924A82